MADLDIERLGGLAGFGGPGARIRSVGRLDLAALSAAERAAVDALFARPPSQAPAHPDGFRYRLTRRTPQGDETVEVPEHLTPPVVAGSVKDELL